MSVRVAYFAQFLKSPHVIGNPDFSTAVKEGSLRERRRQFVVNATSEVMRRKMRDLANTVLASGTRHRGSSKFFDRIIFY